MYIVVLFTHHVERKFSIMARKREGSGANEIISQMRGFGFDSAVIANELKKKPARHLKSKLRKALEQINYDYVRRPKVS